MVEKVAIYIHRTSPNPNLESSIERGLISMPTVEEKMLQTKWMMKIGEAAIPPISPIYDERCSMT